MSASEVKQTLLAALNAYRGDDLARARAAFKNHTPQQMQQQYGSSGKTCMQLLTEYEMHEARVYNALKFVESMS